MGEEGSDLTASPRGDGYTGFSMSLFSQSRLRRVRSHERQVQRLHSCVTHSRNQT